MDYELEEKERNKASTSPPQLVVDLLPRKKREAEKQREITKMIHIELMGEDGEETELQMETFTSPKASQKEKPTESNGKREDVMFASTIEAVDKSDKEPCSPDESRSESTKTLNADAQRKVRREKRPQSLNLGMSRDFVYETEAKSSNITQDSVESDEDNNTEPIEETLACQPTTDTWSPSMTKKLNQPGDAGSPFEERQKEFDKGMEKDLKIHDQGAARSDEAEGQEKPSTEIKIMNTEGKQENQDSVNGPGKDELKKVKTDIRFEVMKVIMIDNNGNNEEPENVDNQRMEELGVERKISNIEPDKTEMVQTAKESRKTSLRVAGHSRTDITRIVPLKPERAKSQGYKDDIDIGQDTELMKRSFKRYSMNESFERHFDPSKFESRDSSSSGASFTTIPIEAKVSPKESSVAITDLCILGSSDQKTLSDVCCSSQEGASRVVHGDLLQLDEGLYDVQHPLPRTPVHQKNAPPTPPVKTKKARESVLILRNSRNFSTDPVLEDKKSLPVIQLGIFCIFSHWTKSVA